MTISIRTARFHNLHCVHKMSGSIVFSEQRTFVSDVRGLPVEFNGNAFFEVIVIQSLLF